MQVAAQLQPADIELTVLMPCLDEANTVGTCVRKAIEACRSAGIEAEVLIADNGSRDGSPELARAAGARVLHVEEKGYGAALRAGILAARGRYVVMGDADDSYEFQDVPRFLERLRAGDELVMGSRFRGVIHPGAMPFLHRFLGNPVLTWILNLFFGAGITDAHCGMRGFSRDAILGLSLRSPGMEFASEMVIRAAQEKLRIGEVPTSLRPDGRGRRPHLRTWRDGWRHLRFLLVFAPRKTLVWPGATLAAFGLLGTALLGAGPLEVGPVGFDINAMVYTCLAVIVGAQLVLFGGFAEIYGWHEGIARYHHVARWTRMLRLERCVAFGLLFIVAGGIGTGIALTQWGTAGFGSLNPHGTIRLVLLSATSISLGVIGLFAGFFTSLLSLRTTQLHVGEPADDELAGV